MTDDTTPSTNRADLISKIESHFAELDAKLAASIAETKAMAADARESGEKTIETIRGLINRIDGIATQIGGRIASAETSALSIWQRLFGK